jgi:hypothetical protein
VVHIWIFSEFLGVYGTDGKSKNDRIEGLTETILKRTRSKLVPAGRSGRRMRCPDRCPRGIVSTEIVRDGLNKANTTGGSFSNSATPRDLHSIDRALKVAGVGHNASLNVILP